MIKRELDRMETMHNMSVLVDKQGNMLDVSLLLLLFLATITCCVCAIKGYMDSNIAYFVIEVVLIWVNMFNFVFTIRRMIRRRKNMKEEQELYEEARRDLLALCEFEEDGWGVELEYEE